LQLADKYITIPWGLKLPPIFYPYEMDNYIDLIKKHNLSFVVCSNSLPNGLVFKDHAPVIKPRQGLGGIGGSYTMKSIALSNAYQLHQALPDLSIIGCGGIRTTEDVNDYMEVGCSAVQIGTHLDRVGLDLFKSIRSG
jgi:dihydroorotate dehydrogenase (fumarate)